MRHFTSVKTRTRALGALAAAVAAATVLGTAGPASATNDETKIEAATGN